ncbi:MAG: hypothetical protein GXY34_03450 [Syntrophomonadaceae bacterium]|nr:hypothetical protein [Syntrophomonadaceae bacterium]
MKDLFYRFERYLIRFILITLVSVIVIQGLMTRDSFRLYLSWSERMEGQGIYYPVSRENVSEKLPGKIQSPQASLVISIESFSSLPMADLLVNGRRCKTFENKDVKITVKAGDRLEIDSTRYSFPVKYRIKAVSQNVGFPEVNSSYTANQGIVMIGNVIVK